MNQQTIDISPPTVAAVAAAGVRFLNLETTLLPGNLKKQLAVLEVYLTGLSQGQLLLATPATDPVESGLDNAGDDPAPTDSPGTEDDANDS